MSLEVEETRTHNGTLLQSELIIPWKDGLQLGDGIDALTGDTMTSPLVNFAQTQVDTSGPVRETSSTSILDYQNLHSLRNEYDMEVFATINVASPGDLGAKVKSVFSNEYSKSSGKIFVQYHVEGRFPMDRLDQPMLKEELQGLPPDKFREKYGDYYVAGIERGYSCRIIAVCSIKEFTKIRTAEIEAMAMVESLFGAKGRKAKEQQQSDTFTFLNATVELWGYQAGEIQFVGGSLEKAFDALESLRERGAPPGLPRSVLLHHYSRLDCCTLPRNIDINPKIFNDLHEMRRLYSQLQIDLLHPSLEGPMIWEIQNTMHGYRDKRGTLAQDSREASSLRAALHQELIAAKEAADGQIGKYNLIRGTRRMSKDIRHFGPFGNGNRYKWECGLLGQEPHGEPTSWLHAGISESTHVRLESGITVHEAHWYTPKTKKGRIFRRSTPRFVKLWGERNSSGPGDAADPTREVEDHVGFHERLYARVIILGWSLSCDWKSKTEPRLTVNEDRCILKDRFEVGLDTSISTVWHCRVTFVLEAEYYMSMR